MDLIRVDEEGIPKIVQHIEWCAGLQAFRIKFFCGRKWDLDHPFISILYGARRHEAFIAIEQIAEIFWFKHFATA